jgi:cupin fold WbuC family metalloprotein
LWVRDEGPVERINDAMMDALAVEATRAARKRSNRNFHSDYADPINRMLNAMEPEAYFPPHRHDAPPKREIFIILRGKVLVVEYADGGGITDYTVISRDAGDAGVEIAPGVWHSIIPLEASVVFEVKDGPYDRDTDKSFAPWAPAEGSPGARQFTESILKRLQWS